MGKNVFWSIKNSGEDINKFRIRGFRSTSLSTYDFFYTCTTLQNNLIKEKLYDLIEWSIKREGLLYLACNERNMFFTSEHQNRYKVWTCQSMCEALICRLDNIFIRFGLSYTD